jgi:hypothetical protein
VTLAVGGFGLSVVREILIQALVASGADNIEFVSHQRGRAPARVAVLARIRGVWALTAPDQALAQLQTLPGSWTVPGPTRPGPREGLEETLTLMGLGVGGSLAKTLSSDADVGDARSRIAVKAQAFCCWRAWLAIAFRRALVAADMGRCSASARPKVLVVGGCRRSTATSSFW